MSHHQDIVEPPSASTEESPFKFLTSGRPLSYNEYSSFWTKVWYNSRFRLEYLHELLTVINDDSFTSNLSSNSVFGTFCVVLTAHLLLSGDDDLEVDVLLKRCMGESKSFLGPLRKTAQQKRQKDLMYEMEFQLGIIDTLPDSSKAGAVPTEDRSDHLKSIMVSQNSGAVQIVLKVLKESGSFIQILGMLLARNSKTLNAKCGKGTSAFDNTQLARYINSLKCLRTDLETINMNALDRSYFFDRLANHGDENNLDGSGLEFSFFSVTLEGIPRNFGKGLNLQSIILTCCLDQSYGTRSGAEAWNDVQAMIEFAALDVPSILAVCRAVEILNCRMPATPAQLQRIIPRFAALVNKPWEERVYKALKRTVDLLLIEWFLPGCSTFLRNSMFIQSTKTLLGASYRNLPGRAAMKQKLQPPRGMKSWPRALVGPPKMKGTIIGPDGKIDGKTDDGRTEITGGIERSNSKESGPTNLGSILTDADKEESSASKSRRPAAVVKPFVFFANRMKDPTLYNFVPLCDAYCRNADLVSQNPHFPIDAKYWQENMLRAMWAYFLESCDLSESSTGMAEGKKTSPAELHDAFDYAVHEFSIAADEIGMGIATSTARKYMTDIFSHVTRMFGQPRILKKKDFDFEKTHLRIPECPFPVAVIELEDQRANRAEAVARTNRRKDSIMSNASSGTAGANSLEDYNPSDIQRNVFSNVGAQASKESPYMELLLFEMIEDWCLRESMEEYLVVGVVGPDSVFHDFCTALAAIMTKETGERVLPPESKLRAQAALKIAYVNSKVASVGYFADSKVYLRAEGSLTKGDGRESLLEWKLGQFDPSYKDIVMSTYKNVILPRYEGVANEIDESVADPNCLAKAKIEHESKQESKMRFVKLDRALEKLSDFRKELSNCLPDKKRKQNLEFYCRSCLPYGVRLPIYEVWCYTSRHDEEPKRRAYFCNRLEFGTTANRAQALSHIGKMTPYDVHPLTTKYRYEKEREGILAKQEEDIFNSISISPRNANAAIVAGDNEYSSDNFDTDLDNKNNGDTPRKNSNSASSAATSANTKQDAVRPHLEKKYDLEIGFDIENCDPNELGKNYLKWPRSYDNVGCGVFDVVFDKPKELSMKLIPESSVADFGNVDEESVEIKNKTGENIVVSPSRGNRKLSVGNRTTTNLIKTCLAGAQAQHQKAVSERNKPSNKSGSEINSI